MDECIYLDASTGGKLMISRPLAAPAWLQIVRIVTQQKRPRWSGMKKTEGRKTEQGPMQNLIVATQVAYFQRTLFEIRNKAAILLLNLRLMLHSLDPKAHSCLILMGEYTRFVKAATHISDLLDFSIEECSSEELRRICQEAIARGEAQDRAKKLAWKRRFRRILLLVVIASSAGLCLRAVDFSAASRWRTSRVIISTGVLFGGGR